MNFFKRLFSCGTSQGNDLFCTPLPSLCLQKENRTTCAHPLIALESSSLISKSTSLSSHMEPKNDSPAKNIGISTKIIKSGETRRSKLQNFDIGFLIGTINIERINPRLCQFLGRHQTINIQKQQISLNNLRPYCLDNLVIYWNEFGCNYPMQELLLVPQNLVVICEEWETLRSIVVGCDEELKIISNKLNLNQVGHRLAYDIVKCQSFFVIEFKRNGFLDKQLKTTIKNLLNYDVNIKQLDYLCSNITLQEYIKLCNKNQDMIKKFTQILVKMNQQTQQPIHNNKNRIQQLVHVQNLIIPRSNNIQKQEPKVNTLSKSAFKSIHCGSDCEEEARYFSPKKQIDSPAEQPSSLHQQLDIFNCENEQTEENIEYEQYLQPRTKINLANPLQNLTKKRSRSEAMKYEQIEFCFDNQLFEKYQ